MNLTFHAALVGWIPTLLLLFAVMPHRRVVAFALVAGTLFLPQGGYDFASLPRIDRHSLTSIGVAIGTMLAGPQDRQRFAPRWFDVPMACWCVWPLASSVANGLGLYDGISAVFGQLMLWGVPYYAGRIYFGDAEGLQTLRTALLVGGLAYAPLCLYEVRMGSVLHLQVYGFHPRTANQRAGLFGLPHSRYRVFFGMSINAAVFMAYATIIALSECLLEMTGRILRLPVRLVAGALGLTTVLARVTTADALLLLGSMSLVGARAMRSAWPVIAICLLPIVMVGARVAGWGGGQLTTVTRDLAEDKVQSLDARIANDSRILRQVMLRPVFGWGSSGESFRTEDVSAVDGLWIIAAGKSGIVGLLGLYVGMLLPALVYMRRIGLDRMIGIRPVEGQVLVVLVSVYMIHCVFNTGYYLPLVAAAGALGGASGLRGETLQSTRMLSTTSA